MAVGLLMLVWFLSGIGMLFIRWPEVTPNQRAAARAPIVWTDCCRVADTPDVREVKAAVVEMLDGRPVLRLDGELVDLITGGAIREVGPAAAARIAQTHARALGIADFEPETPVAITRDQWTVTGYFDRHRPFWRVAGGDAAATHIYVSARDGLVAQVTDRRVRALAWLGPIPHWLYPTMLRANVALWSQVVIWASILGVFLTATGLYLGVIAWPRRRDARLSPYRGLMAWHHLAGLAGGVLTLTWTASGLVSMNPWGFLESGHDRRSEQLSGAYTLGDVIEAVDAAREQGVAARRLEAAPLGGRLYLMADGVRLDAAGRPDPLTSGALAEAVRRTGGIASQGLMTREDAYYRGHHDAVALPVWRVIGTDGARHYLSPASGQVLQRFDANARGYRWLFEAPHRLDFAPGFDRGGGWAAMMIGLLAFAGLVVATGVWLGVRRVRADLARTEPKGTRSA